MKADILRILAAVLIVIVVIFFCVAISHSADFTLVWGPSTSPDVAGYRLFQRTEGQAYDYDNPVYEGDPNVLTTIIPNVPEGTSIYWVCRAFDALDMESVDSNECGDPFVGPPLPPGDGSDTGLKCFINSSN